MASAIPQGRLAEIVREAQARTGVPVAAAALHADRQTTFAGAHERPFPIASGWRTASSGIISINRSQRRSGRGMRSAGGYATACSTTKARSAGTSRCCCSAPSAGSSWPY
jgi:hypothetical protein